MKITRYLFNILLIVCSYSFATQASAALILEDTLVLGGIISKTDLAAIANDPNGCNLNSGNGNPPSAELCWANSVLAASGASTTFAGKDESVSVTYEMMGNVTFGIVSLAGSPDYYIVKNANAFALMDNSIDPTRGVFDYVALNVAYDNKYNDPNPAFNLGGMTVSHVTRFGGGGNQVPEPASIALLMGGGIAALSVSGFRRRKSTH